MTSIPAYLTSAVLICNTSVNCQDVSVSVFAADKVLNYKLIIEVPLTPCNIIGNANDSASMQVAEPGSVFTVVGSKDPDSVIIRFWKWKENQGLNNLLCYADSLCLTRKYFSIPVTVLNERAIRRYDRKPCFTAGTVLIPVKLRLNKFDFSKDITLGPVAGIKFRLSNYTNNFISVLAGLGITSITLNKHSTDGRVEEDTDVPALTPSLGFVFDFINSTQAGLFFGWDFISDNENMNLIYYGKLWLSFGLGFSILTRGSNCAVGEEEKQ